MDLKDFAKWTVMAAAIVAVHFSNADQQTTAVDTISLYRVTLDTRTSLPDHLAYLSLMQNMRQANDNAGISVEHIKSHLALDDEAARKFRSFVVASYDEMTETNTEITQRMLCVNDGARYETDAAHAVLDILDDIKETNLKRQLRRAYHSFGRARAEELALWLEDIKAGTADHPYDRERDFNYDRFSVEELVSTACGALASTNSFTNDNSKNGAGTSTD